MLVLIKKKSVDEEGHFLLRGTATSDHNSIILEMSMKDVGKKEQEKVIRWRLNAPVEKWEKFKEDLLSTWRLGFQGWK